MIEDTYKHNGMDIQIFWDEYPSDPRKEWDHTATMYCAHSRYDLGDVQIPSGVEDSLEWVRDEVGTGDCVILPLYLYDHSGISMSVGSFSHVDPGGWDSGIVGVIVGKIEDYPVDWNFDQVRDSMIAEVKEYDQYLTGDIFGYDVMYQGENLDSCCGYYGSESAVEEANSMADWWADVLAYHLASLNDALDNAVDVNKAIRDMNELNRLEAA